MFTICRFLMKIERFVMQTWCSFLFSFLLLLAPKIKVVFIQKKKDIFVLVIELIFCKHLKANGTILKCHIPAELYWSWHNITLLICTLFWNIYVSHIWSVVLYDKIWYISVIWSLRIRFKAPKCFLFLLFCTWIRSSFDGSLLLKVISPWAHGEKVLYSCSWICSDY